jgi:8-oxo-dGTP diphosphatase
MPLTPASAPVLLARGPWAPDDIEATWLAEAYEAPAERTEAADDAIAALRDRGSPSHDGVGARLVDHRVHDGRLMLELQPVRWALRLVEGHASGSLSALCAVRDSDGRWLAGRRAAWLSTWAGRWALGAGGAVDLGESPAETLSRELHEEWQLEPEALSVEALVGLPNRVVMVVGLATVPDGAVPVPDPEHDEWAWWPADIDAWPAEADDRLKLMARLLSA